MPLSNYERQKKWREKNRAIYNLRRRNARKENEEVSTHSGTSKIEQLRQLIANPNPIESVKPTVFKDDYGKIITEHQWDKLQELKLKAKDGGYEIDDYTQ